MDVQLADLDQLIATGHCAEIYQWPPDTDQVIKLFPPEYPKELVDAEYVACREASRLDIGALRCHELMHIEDHSGLVFDRLHGLSLTSRALRNPFRLFSSSKALARAHARIHSVETTALPDIRTVLTEALDSPSMSFLTPEQRSTATSYLADLPSGNSLLHLDFHTENVFCHNGGHTIIDWQTAASGHPAADVAMTALLLRDGELWPGTPLLEKVAINSARGLMLAIYLSHYRKLTDVSRNDVRAWRLPALILRLSSIDLETEGPRFRAEIERTIKKLS